MGFGYLLFFSTDPYDLFYPLLCPFFLRLSSLSLLFLPFFFSSLTSSQEVAVTEIEVETDIAERGWGLVESKKRETGGE